MPWYRPVRGVAARSAGAPGTRDDRDRRSARWADRRGAGRSRPVPPSRVPGTPFGV